MTELTKPFAIIISKEYMMPFQTIEPANIFVIGMEKPIEAWNAVLATLSLHSPSSLQPDHRLEEVVI
jgi:hypothetical protein